MCGKKVDFLEEEFEEYNHPLDTDSDSVEHPLSESFAKQHHRQRVTIMTTDNEEDEGTHVTVCDASRAMDVMQHQYFMEDADMVECTSSCIQGVDVTLDACSMVREKVVAMTNQLMKRLERKLLSL